MVRFKFLAICLVPATSFFASEYSQCRHMGKGLVCASSRIPCSNRPRGGRRGARTLWASDTSTSGRHAAARFAPVAKSAMQSNRRRNAPDYTVMEITKITCIDLKFHRCSFGNGLDASNRKATTTLGARIACMSRIAFCWLGQLLTVSKSTRLRQPASGLIPCRLSLASVRTWSDHSTRSTAQYRTRYRHRSLLLPPPVPLGSAPHRRGAKIVPPSSVESDARSVCRYRTQSGSEGSRDSCANPAADRGHETNVVVWAPIVFGEHVLPAAFHMQVAVLEHRDNRCFRPPRAHARH